MEKIPSGIVGDMGIALARFTFGKLGLIFREKPTLDHGIDGEVELVSDGRATGRLIAAQIKCGQSYFSETTDSHIVYRFSEDHFLYWVDHCLPVIVIVVDHEKQLCFWAQVDVESARNTGKGFKLHIPWSQVLDEKAVPSFSAIATQLIGTDRFDVISQPPAFLGTVHVTETTVVLASSEANWTKPEIEQVVRQATAAFRTEPLARNRDPHSPNHERRQILATVFATLAEGGQKAVARAEGRHGGGVSISDYWLWQFVWDENYFQHASTKPLSVEAERFIARIAWPHMAMFSTLNWLISTHGGYQGRWLANRLKSLADDFVGLERVPPAECMNLHQHLTNMLRCAKDCQSLAATEDDWNGKLPVFYKHHKVGDALLNEALEHGAKANAELTRLTPLMSIQ